MLFVHVHISLSICEQHTIYYYSGEFVKPATSNQAKSGTCPPDHKKNYYEYEQAMKQIVKIYVMGEKTWTQYEDGVHIAAHFHLCKALSITLTLAYRFIFNWFVQSRRRRGATRRKDKDTAKDHDRKQNGRDSRLQLTYSGSNTKGQSEYQKKRKKTKKDKKKKKKDKSSASDGDSSFEEPIDVSDSADDLLLLEKPASKRLKRT